MRTLNKRDIEKVPWMDAKHSWFQARPARTYVLN